MRSSDVLRVMVSINGQEVSGLIQASIATTNCFSADTFALTFAMTGSRATNVTFWSLLSSAMVEVTAVILSIDGPISQTLITGMADTIHVNPIQGTVGVEGRDLSAKLIDSYRQQDFVNQTASEVVSTIAQYHGLEPIISFTSGNIGRYYGDGYTRLSLGQFSRLQSDWDLVVQLARQNAFDVFVRGHSLYFMPSGARSSSPVHLSLQNVEAAKIERQLGVTDNTVVKVQSWNSQNMAAYESDGNLSYLANLESQQSGLPFLFSGSNYTSQQVTQIASQYASEVTRLRTVLTIHMPWDLAFVPREACVLLDTGSAFDNTYLIDTIERHYSPTFGSQQIVRANQI